MTIKSVLTTYNKIESELLLSFVLKKSKEFLYTHPETKLTAKQLKTFQSLANRRTKDEPIAYILGFKNFYGLRFKVTKDTLIPRPETEWLVEKVLQLADEFDKDKKLNILDTGTGSGCIAISIQKHLRNTNITATDISSKALLIAKFNAKKNNTKIKFLQSNLFSKIKKQKFDIIIANLPYVPIRDYQKLETNLKYEPKSAITDNTNTFVTYQKFFKQVNNYLNPKGIILLEIDPKTKKFILSYAKNSIPGSQVTFYKDLN